MLDHHRAILESDQAGGGWGGGGGGGRSFRGCSKCRSRDVLKSTIYCGETVLIGR